MTNADASGPSSAPADDSAIAEPDPGFSARLTTYKAIEVYRDRPLIVYATSTRMNVAGVMAGDTFREFIDQIDAIPDGDTVDVLIHSAGGDPLAAWKLMSLLRERFKQVHALVPFMPFSAATIFCLGAHEIVMHPHASLGPIDPQITVDVGGEKRHFSYEDVGAFLRFLSREVGISDEVNVTTVVEKLLGTVDPLSVGYAQRASELSTEVGERLLLMHMKSKEQAREIAENLNKSFYAHGDAVSRSRAAELGLKVHKRDEQLESLMWDAYVGLENFMELRKPFVALQEVLADEQAASQLSPPAPLVMPANTPPQVAKQLWEQVANQAVQAMSGGAREVEYSIVNALSESLRTASVYRTSGTVSACRFMGGEIKLSATDREAGWRSIRMPETL